MAKKKTYSEIAATNGMVAGYASTWIREPDSYGDIVAKGAFSNSIAKIKRKGLVIPLLFNHDAGTLEHYIGTVTYLEEDDHGLFFEAVFDDTPEAQRARELIKSKRITGFSFAYDVLNNATVTLPDGRRANELRELDLKEISLTMYPANRDVSVVAVKRQRLLEEAEALMNGLDGKGVSGNKTIRKLLKEADALINRSEV